MLWHELKAQGEDLVFGCGTPHDLVENKGWAEKYQDRMAEAGYALRIIGNPKEIEALYDVERLRANYAFRMIPVDVLPLDNQTAIYNDTVSLYCWRQEQKVGLEIINSGFANTMRLMFEAYWQIASKKSPETASG
jgi:hypothetical protein